MNANNASLTVEQARIMKKINPKFRFLVYENAELGPMTHEATKTIASHPEWWARTDAGAPISTSQGYELNQGYEVRKWFVSYPIQVFGDDAKHLLDGVFFDGMGYNPQRFKGVSLPRHDAWYAGKMQMADEARALYGGMNGGEVWGNGAVGVTAGYHNFTYNGEVRPPAWKRQRSLGWVLTPAALAVAARQLAHLDGPPGRGVPGGRGRLLV